MRKLPYPGRPCTLDASTGTFTGPMLISPGQARRDNKTSDSPGYLIMNVDPVTHSGKNTLKAVITNDMGRTSEESLTFYYYQLFVKSEGQNISNGSPYSQWQSWNLDLFGDCPFGPSWTQLDKESKITAPPGSYYQNNDNPTSMVFSGLYTYAYIYREWTDSNGNKQTDTQDATTDLTFHSLPLTEEKLTPMVLLLKGIGFTTPPLVVDTSQVKVNGQPLKELRLNSRTWPYNIYYILLNEYEPDKDYSLTVEGVPVAQVVQGEVSGFEFSQMSLITGDILSDSNNDGLLGGEDNAVEKISPGCVFWVNSDDDSSESTIHPDDADAAYDEFDKDYEDDAINGIRDLEDFMPIDLTIPNIKEWANNQNIKFYLKAEGDGKIRIFKRVDDNDEESTKTYLVDLDKSIQQYTEKMKFILPASEEGQLLDPSWFDSEGKFYGIFEGVTTGTLKLTLYVGLNNGVDKVVLDEAYITLKDVKEMYRFINIRGNGIPRQGEGADTLIRYRDMEESGDFPFKNPDSILIWTHGFNSDLGQSRVWIETVYKRLYQTGYRGGFIGITWQGDVQFFEAWSRSFQTSHLISDIIRDAKKNYPDAKINVSAHSLGNNNVSYALRLLAEEAKMQIDNLILAESAIPGNAFSGKTYWGPLEIRDFFDNMYGIDTLIVKNRIFNTYSTSDDVLWWWFQPAAAISLSTPLDDNYHLINENRWKTTLSGALGLNEAESTHGRFRNSSFYPLNYDSLANENTRPYGIRNHSSMREDYYYDEQEFYKFLKDPENYTRPNGERP